MQKSCPHCGTDMTRIDGVYALTKIQKEDGNVTFYPNQGVPVIVFGCSKPNGNCNGTLHLYPAKALGEI